MESVGAGHVPGRRRWRRWYRLALASWLALAVPWLADAADPVEEAPPPADAADAPAQPPESAEALDASVLGRTMELRKDQAYVEGAEQVVWRDNIVHLKGGAYIRFENMVLESENAWADFDENVLRAEGNVRLRVDEEVTYADELVFNLRTKQGIAHGGAAYGSPWYYQGYRILRVSEKESLINGGRLTTSSLKYPHTYFRASRIIVHLDNEIIAKHVVFMIGGVPLLYIPAYRRSIREKRPSTVIVKLGSDTFQGNWFSVNVPLARRQRVRSAVQFDYSSLRGTGEGTETKYQIRDVELREIRFDIPEDATTDEKTALKRRASEIRDRLAGDFDQVLVQRLFLPHPRAEDDVTRARQRADEIQAGAAKGEDLERLGGRFSILGYLVPGDAALTPDLESVALLLEYGQVSPVVATESGFYIFRVSDTMDLYGTVEKQVQQVFVPIQASDESKQETADLAQRLLRSARNGEDFAAMLSRYGSNVPESAWTDSEKERRRGVGVAAQTPGSASDSSEPVPQGPPGAQTIRTPINDFDYSQRRLLTELQVGETTEAISVDEGILLLRLADKEPTPDFAQLAREISNAESAEDGGYIGYTGRGDVPLNVYRASVGLEKGEVSSVIEAPEALYVVQAGRRRTMNGEVYLFTKDIYSYGRQETFKIGRQWDGAASHRMEVPTPWDKTGRYERRGVTFWGKVQYGNRNYFGSYGTDRAELQTFGVVTFSSISGQGATSVDGRLTVDKTFELSEDSSGTNQRLPELTLSWSSELERLWGLRRINDRLMQAARRVDRWKLPLLAVPTLTDANFSLDGTIANLYRNEFRYSPGIQAIRQARGLSADETEDVFLQAGDLGLDVSKQSKLKLTQTREFVLSLRGSTQAVWHQKDQKGNTNIIRPLVSASSSLSNLLFRVWDIGWVPGANRLRHEVRSEAGFDWAPSANDADEDPDNPSPDTIKLYPFGSSTYLYERKLLRLSLTSNVQIKTRANKVVNALTLSVRTSRDYTDRSAVGDRKWEFISGTMNFSPLSSGNLYGTLQTTVDPNTYSPTSTIQRAPFSLIGLSSALHYRGGNYTKGWNLDLGSQYTNYTSARRSFLIGGSWRPSTLLEISLDTQWDYDRDRIANPTGWRTNSLARSSGVAYLHPFSQNLTLRRNLRDWDLHITWRRYGSIGNVRKEFTYQINLIADPMVTMGAGYDGITQSWGFRSLPIGVPSTFTAGGLGRSGF